MGIIAADLFITLDGVYQAPGGRDEDRSGGFEFGGWQAPLGDAAVGATIMASIERTDALLLGRRTYDIFSSFWPFQSLTDPVAAKFAAIPKFVVSRTLTDPSWAGTTVLREASEVGSLRGQFDEVHTWGSGELLRALLAEGLLDRLNLWVYPTRARHRQAPVRVGRRADHLPTGQADASLRVGGRGASCWSLRAASRRARWGRASRSRGDGQLSGRHDPRAQGAGGTGAA